MGSPHRMEPLQSQQLLCRQSTGRVRLEFLWQESSSIANIQSRRRGHQQQQQYLHFETTPVGEEYRVAQERRHLASQGLECDAKHRRHQREQFGRFVRCHKRTENHPQDRHGSVLTRTSGQDIAHGIVRHPSGLHRVGTRQKSRFLRRKGFFEAGRDCPRGERTKEFRE